MLDFLRKKLAGRSFLDLAQSEIEGWLFWLSGSFPGAFGFVVRYAVCKLLFRRLDGFCWIDPRVTIVKSSRLSVGKNFGCNSGSYIGATGGVTIGDFVLIGTNVMISSAVHEIEGRMPPVFARPVVERPVSIEDDVWIAAGAVILPGVTLRKGTVVGANAVVNRDTEEYGVYVGAPARLVRYRDGREIS